MDKQTVLESLRDFSKNFPKDALLEVRANKQDYIIELLTSLDYVNKNAEKLCEENSDYFLHIYGMYMLAEFKELKTFPYIIEMLKQPEDSIEYIFGDALTEDVYQILFNTFSHKHLHMLFEIIENVELYKWARLSALNTYKLLCFENIVTKEDFVGYLRSLIYDKLPPDDSYIVFTGIVGCVIDIKLTEMIQDVRFLYDDNRIDASMYGKFDGFIDSLFREERHRKMYCFDDAISKMVRWCCFERENTDESLEKNDLIDDFAHDMLNDIKNENTIISENKKIGRNDPCPCGSGKKYKKCCYATDQNSQKTLTPRIEDKYDLLEWYPKDSKLFMSTYSEEAIKVDMPVYKALSHRTIPLWVQRDWEQERIGKIYYLNEALALFTDKCQKEKILTFDDYDKQHIVHYPSSEWVSALINLIEDSDTTEILNIKKLAEDIFQKFSNSITS